MRYSTLNAWLATTVIAIAGQTLLAEPEPPYASITRAELMATLEALPEQRSVRGGSDPEANHAGLEETARQLADALRAMGLEPQEQVFTWAPILDWDSSRVLPTDIPVRTRNIWVDITGKSKPGEVVMASAHYDAYPGSPGMNDNGTGVAAILAMARVFAETQPERTIRLIFFTAEEFSLGGSRRFVMEHVQPKLESGEETFVGLINLDMIGAFSDEPGSQELPDNPLIKAIFGEAPKGNFLAALSIAGARGVSFARFNATALGAMRRAAPDLPIFDTSFLPEPLPDMMRSDHAHFWTLGIPAIFCTDTADFRTPHYHQPTDTIEHIDPARFTLAARAVAAAVWALANEP